MATSQNGWAVDFDGSEQDHGPVVRDVKVPNGMLRGDVATVLRYVAGRFDREVEQLRAGWCWGWYVKKIEGSSQYSNHSSGTAIDLNAPDHPMGSRGTFSGAQVVAIRRILNACDGVVRWGGDYTSRADEMHWEIVKGAAAVAALARKITERRTVSYVQIDGRLPVLQLGDSDPVDESGTRWVERVQRALGVDVDGVYGPITAAALDKRMAGIPSTTTNGSKVGEPEWRKLYGIW